MNDANAAISRLRPLVLGLSLCAMAAGFAAAAGDAADQPVEPAQPVASAQDAPAPPQGVEPDETDEPGEESGEESAPPSLDDLLGLDEDEAAEETARRVAEEQVQQRLTGEEIASAFDEAIANMGRSAELLEERFDTGLGTQRIQQDVLTKLQQLINEARQQSSSSSSSSQQQQQQQQQQSNPGQQQQQQQQGSQAQRQEGPAESGQELEGPAFRDGEVNPMLEETRSEWGSLPQRVRDMLLQGREERFSSLYEQMTREYYRRLAEED